MTTDAIRKAHTAISPPAIDPAVVSLPFRWLRDANAAFAAYVHFKELTRERLRDVGLTKKQQDEAFLRQFAPKKYD
ncbi:hypothetical protein [Oricola cellulosilytica]|uniref:DUF1127 domain-containing protein n=1 Tax=Oricola cellulosilytica TaxID=1429082 RepID=A0A4R0PA88_9HYPH|nr:hypothetical protein [Oricola cellulosilytica]TCD14160.1 hypothetical protein E0D97_08710 [Oricola cellulosilytica]